MSLAAGARTLRAMLEHRAASTPDRTFLIYDDMAGGVLRLSYGDFDQQVNRHSASAAVQIGLPSRRTDTYSHGKVTTAVTFEPITLMSRAILADLAAA